MPHKQTIERAVVLALLAEPRWSRAGLEVKLHDISPLDIADALAHLVQCLVNGFTAGDLFEDGVG